MARTNGVPMASGKKPTAKKVNAKKMATSSRSQVKVAGNAADGKAFKKRNRNQGTAGGKTTGKMPY